MIKYILQKIADYLFNKLEKSTSEKEFEHYYGKCMLFDQYCIDYFDLYLE